MILGFIPKEHMLVGLQEHNLEEVGYIRRHGSGGDRKPRGVCWDHSPCSKFSQSGSYEKKNPEIFGDMKTPSYILQQKNIEDNRQRSQWEKERKKMDGGPKEERTTTTKI